MNLQAEDLWRRAVQALNVARHDLLISPDAAASRAYYAAFYAVSASFALDNRTFTRHSAVEAAVHRDLVKTGRWSVEMGQRYSHLAELRTLGDYGSLEHVSSQEAMEAIQIAEQILQAIGDLNPEFKTIPEL